MGYCADFLSLDPAAGEVGDFIDRGDIEWLPQSALVEIGVNFFAGRGNGDKTDVAAKRDSHHGIDNSGFVVLPGVW